MATASMMQVISRPPRPFSPLVCVCQLVCGLTNFLKARRHIESRRTALCVFLSTPRTAAARGILPRGTHRIPLLSLSVRAPAPDRAACRCQRLSAASAARRRLAAAPRAATAASPRGLSQSLVAASMRGSAGGAPSPSAMTKRIASAAFALGVVTTLRAVAWRDSSARTLASSPVPRCFT